MRGAVYFVVVFDAGICYNKAMAKKAFRTVAALVIAVLCAIGLSGCKIVVDGVDATDYTGVQYTTYDYFNTYCSVSCYLPASETERFKELWDNDIREVLNAVSGSVSVDGETSSIAAFNNAKAGEKIEIDKTAYDALTLAKQAYETTGGAFNPAIALSVDLWGFSPRFNGEEYVASAPYDRADYRAQLPEEKYVQAFKTLADFSKTSVYEEDGRYYAVKADIAVTVDGREYTQQLNLNGIGKGYCADLIAGLMRENGFEFGYVSIGGSSLSVLKNARKEVGTETGKWSVSVLSPVDSGKNYFKVYLKDTSLATSGGYQQYYEINGKRYSHIIDPATGAPYNSDVLTASVYGENAALCDAYSTALCVLGEEKAAEFMKSLDGYTYTMAIKTGDRFRVVTNAEGKEIK